MIIKKHVKYVQWILDITYMLLSQFYEHWFLAFSRFLTKVCGHFNRSRKVTNTPSVHWKDQLKSWDPCREFFIWLNWARDIVDQRGLRSADRRNPNFLKMLPYVDLEENASHHFSRSPKVRQKWWPRPTFALGIWTWGEYNWNLRRKSCWSESRMLHLDTIWQ